MEPLIVTAALIAALALIATAAWWHTRRALRLERAARRITDAAAVRAQHAADHNTAVHRQLADRARSAMTRRLREEAVLRAADLVLDQALSKYHPHEMEGDSDA